MIDWSKYGFKDSDPGAGNLDNTGIDWGKYITSDKDKQRLEQEQSDMAEMYQASHANDPVKPSLGSILKTNASRLAEPVTSAWKFLNRVSAAGAAALAPKAPMFKKGGGYDLEAPTPYERANERKESLGNGGFSDKVADVIGEGASYFLNPGGLAQGPMAIYNNPAVQNVAGRIAGKLTRGLPDMGYTLAKDGSRVIDSLASRAIQEGAKEAVTAGLYAAPRALIEGESDPVELAKRTLIEGGLGAATGAALPFAGAAIGKAVRRFTGRPMMEAGPSMEAYEAAANVPRMERTTRMNEDAVENILNRKRFIDERVYGDSTLGLPEPKVARAARELERRSVQPAGLDPIQAPGEVPTFALPEGKGVQPPTRARLGRQVNPFQQKFEALMETAKQQDLPPGREREYLEDLWSRMAGPQDPGLDELIERAYPRTESKVTPDLVQRAREQQRLRETYGVPGPVKTQAERFPSSVEAPAAMPETLVGRLQKKATRTRQAAPEVAATSEIEVMQPKLQKRATGRRTEPRVVREAEYTSASSSEGVQRMAAPDLPYREPNPEVKVQEMAGLEKVASKVKQAVGQDAPREPITRQKVIDNIRQRFGVTVRTGRLGIGDEAVKGLFKVRSEVIRSRAANDIQVISHELGHNLDKRYNLQDPFTQPELLNLIRQNKDIDVSAYRPDELHAEGVAEFIRYYLTDPAKAKKLAPRFFDHFEKVTAEVGDSLRATQQDVATWIDQGAALQFRGKINRTGKDTSKTVGDRIDDAYTDFIDRYNPMKVAEVGIKGALGDASESLYKQARLFAGAPKKAQQILQDMKQILKPIDTYGYTMKDVGDYAAAVHAKELEGLDIESGFTADEINAVLSKYGNDENMKRVQKQLVTYNNNLLDMLVEGGMLTKEAVEAMRTKYPNYMPFNRFFDEDMAKGFGGKGFADLTNPVKRMKGSTRDIIDPLESMVKNTFAVVNAVEKNKVGLQLAKLADFEGAGKFVERLNGAQSVPKENILTVFENGQRVQYQVEPELYRAMMGLDEDVTNKLVKLFSVPASVLRTGATLTPEFILRNPIRDQFSAFVVSNYGYNPIVDLPRGMFSVLKGKLGKNGDKYYEQWVREGGGYGNYLSQDRDYLREQLGQLKDERNKWARATVAIVNPKEWLKLLQVMGEFTEEATKVGEFKRGLRKGATPQEAAFQSRDLMDFGRSGNNIKQINRVVTFLNANLQGKDRLLRAFKENKVRTSARALAGVTIPTLGFLAWNHIASNDKQKETINNAPDWLRDTFWLISVPGTDVVARIPKPHDLAPIFANLPEHIYKYVAKEDPRAADEFAKDMLKQQASVPMMLTGLTPWIENMANYSFFTDGPIVPRRDQDMEPAEQYGPTTSLTARSIGKLTKTSPYKVDNLIRGYGAGLGKYATAGTDFVLEKAGAGRMPTKEEKKVSEYPVINAFTVDSTGGGKVMDQFYSKLQKTTKKFNSNEKNKVEDAETRIQKKTLEKASRDIGELRTKYRVIQGDMDMNSSEKRKQLDELDDKMNAIARRTLEKIATK